MATPQVSTASWPPLPAPYRPIIVLGAGAAGVVYLVHNSAQNRLEAIKVLQRAPSTAADGAAQARFVREVEAMQLLSHPCMVPTFSRGVLADGRLFFTMEYVEGSSLHDIVLRRGPLPVSLALGILAEVADALHHAHEAGIVHRDLKPHNLMLCSHPHGARVRVLDFGMSKILGESGPGAVLTRDGAVFGTPAYMSPEQSRGRRPDRRSDIYALGCVGYELLLGRPPFRGSVAELFAAHVMTPPRAPSVVDGDGAIAPDVDAVILRCLEKRVEDRFQSGADLCAAIQALDDYRPLRVARAP